MTESAMRPTFLALVTAAVLALAAAPAEAQGTASRGQLLYATHCVECHTTQVHWRERHLARDWGSLKEWVRHWQAQAQLQWSDDDIAAVSRHLNDTIYQFPLPQAQR